MVLRKQNPSNTVIAEDKGSTLLIPTYATGHDISKQSKNIHHSWVHTTFKSIFSSLNPLLFLVLICRRSTNVDKPTYQ
jgi:hypothetical protein